MDLLHYLKIAWNDQIAHLGYIFVDSLLFMICFKYKAIKCPDFHNNKNLKGVMIHKYTAPSARGLDLASTLYSKQR